jgi:enamine deaminase RidA (YjgF/YER057c/UK114 family)
MERQVVNPWTWQDAFGFVQANKVSGVDRFVFCAGQTSVDAEGRPLHSGDMKAQITQALDNLETVLRDAGMNLSDVVRLNYYTIDVDGFIAEGETVGRRLAEGQCRPAATLLGVTRLAFPEILIEIEATAMA